MQTDSHRHAAIELDRSASHSHDHTLDLAYSRLIGVLFFVVTCIMQVNS